MANICKAPIPLVRQKAKEWGWNPNVVLELFDSNNSSWDNIGPKESAPTIQSLLVGDSVNYMQSLGKATGRKVQYHLVAAKMQAEKITPRMQLLNTESKAIGNETSTVLSIKNAIKNLNNEGVVFITTASINLNDLSPKTLNAKEDAKTSIQQAVINADNNEVVVYSQSDDSFYKRKNNGEFEKVDNYTVGNKNAFILSNFTHLEGDYKKSYIKALSNIDKVLKSVFESNEEIKAETVKLDVDSVTFEDLDTEDNDTLYVCTSEVPACKKPTNTFNSGDVTDCYYDTYSKIVHLKYKGKSATLSLVKEVGSNNTVTNRLIGSKWISNDELGDIFKVLLTNSDFGTILLNFKNSTNNTFEFPQSTWVKNTVVIPTKGNDGKTFTGNTYNEVSKECLSAVNTAVTLLLEKIASGKFSKIRIVTNSNGKAYHTTTNRLYIAQQLDTIFSNIGSKGNYAGNFVESLNNVLNTTIEDIEGFEDALISVEKAKLTTIMPAYLRLSITTSISKQFADFIRNIYEESQSNLGLQGKDLKDFKLLQRINRDELLNKTYESYLRYYKFKNILNVLKTYGIDTLIKLFLQLLYNKYYSNELSSAELSLEEVFNNRLELLNTIVPVRCAVSVLQNAHKYIDENGNLLLEEGYTTEELIADFKSNINNSKIYKEVLDKKSSLLVYYMRMVSTYNNILKDDNLSLVLGECMPMVGLYLGGISITKRGSKGEIQKLENETTIDDDGDSLETKDKEKFLEGLVDTKEGWMYKEFGLSNLKDLSAELASMLLNIIATREDGTVLLNDLGEPIYMRKDLAHAMLLDALIPLVFPKDYVCQHVVDENGLPRVLTPKYTLDGCLKELAEKNKAFTQLVNFLSLEKDLSAEHVSLVNSFFSLFKTDFNNLIGISESKGVSASNSVMRVNVLNETSSFFALGDTLNNNFIAGLGENRIFGQNYTVNRDVISSLQKIALSIFNKASNTKTPITLEDLPAIESLLHSLGVDVYNEDNNSLIRPLLERLYENYKKVLNKNSLKKADYLRATLLYKLVDNINKWYSVLKKVNIDNFETEDYAHTYRTFIGAISNVLDFSSEDRRESLGRWNGKTLYAHTTCNFLHLRCDLLANKPLFSEEDYRTLLEDMYGEDYFLCDKEIDDDGEVTYNFRNRILLLIYDHPSLAKNYFKYSSVVGINKKDSVDAYTGDDMLFADFLLYRTMTSNSVENPTDAEFPWQASPITTILPSDANSYENLMMPVIDFTSSVDEEVTSRENAALDMMYDVVELELLRYLVRQSRVIRNLLLGKYTSVRDNDFALSKEYANRIDIEATDKCLNNLLDAFLQKANVDGITSKKALQEYFNKHTIRDYVNLVEKILAKASFNEFIKTDEIAKCLKKKPLVFYFYEGLNSYKNADGKTFMDLYNELGVNSNKCKELFNEYIDLDFLNTFNLLYNTTIFDESEEYKLDIEGNSYKAYTMKYFTTKSTTGKAEHLKGIKGILSNIEKAAKDSTEDGIQEMLTLALEFKSNGDYYNYLQTINSINDIIKESLNFNLSIVDIVRRYYLNLECARNTMILLFNSDFSSNGSAMKFIKRAKLWHAPGIRLNTEAVWMDSNSGELSKVFDKPYLNVLVLLDTELQDEYKASRLRYVEIFEAKGLSSNSIDTLMLMYDSAKITDAQGFISLPFYRKVMIALGGEHWSKEAEDAYNNIINGNFTFADIILIYNTIKSYHFSVEVRDLGIMIDGLRVKMGESEQMKLSLLAMLSIFGALGASDTAYAMYNNSPIQKLTLLMKDKGIDSVEFASASKNDTKGAVDLNELLEDLDYQLQVFRGMDASTSLYTNPFIRRNSLSGFMIQTKVPDHHMDSEMLDGTQASKIAISNLDDDTLITINGSTMNKDLIVSSYKKAIALNIRDHADNLLKNGAFKDINALSKKLQDEIRGNDRYDADLLEACLLDSNGKFNLSLLDATQLNRISELLTSLIRLEITLHKRNGAAYVLDSTVALNKNLRVRYKASKEGNDDIDVTDLSSEEVSKLKAEGWKVSVDCYECMIPVYNSELREYLQKNCMNADGTIDMSKVNPLLLELYGYRIPTEDKYSTMPLKVVGFITELLGGAIILPQEITAITGSDFDIDKLFVELPNITFDDNGEPFVEVCNYNLLESASVEERENFISTIRREILRTPQMMSLLLNPGNFKLLTDIGNGMEILRQHNKEELTSILKNLGIEDATKDNVAYKVLELIEKAKKGDTLSADILNKVASSTKSAVDIGNAVFNSYYHNRIRRGKLLLGVFAVANSAHCLDLFYKKYKIKNGWKLFGETSARESLSEIKNADGEYINRILGMHIGACADVVKDDAMADLGVDMPVASLDVMLKTLGYSVEDVSLLLNQPIVRDFVKSANDKGSYDAREDLSTAIEFYKDRYLELSGNKYKGSDNTRMNSESITDPSSLALNIVDANEYASITLKNNLAALYYYKLIQIGNLVYDLMTTAMLFNDVTLAHRLDSTSGSVDKSFAINEFLNFKLDYLRSKEGSSDWNLSGITEVLPNTDLNLWDATTLDNMLAFLTYGLLFLLKCGVTKQLFFLNSPKFRAIINEVAKLCKDGMPSENVIKALEKHYIAFYLMKHMALANLNNSTEDIRKEVLMKFPLTIRDYKEDPDFKDISLIRNLSYKGVYTKAKLKKNNKPFGRLEYKKGGSTIERREAEKNSWRTLYNMMLNPEVNGLKHYSEATLKKAKDLILNLVRYALYSSGFNFSAMSYIESIPYEIKKSIKGYNLAYDALLSRNMLEELDNLDKVFIELFIRNTPSNYSLTPRIYSRKAISDTGSVNMKVVMESKSMYGKYEGVASYFTIVDKLGVPHLYKVLNGGSGYKELDVLGVPMYSVEYDPFIENPNTDTSKTVLDSAVMATLLASAEEGEDNSGTTKTLASKGNNTFDSRKDVVNLLEIKSNAC